MKRRIKRFVSIDLVFGLVVFGILLYTSQKAYAALTNTFDTATPRGSDAPSSLDDQDRLTKAAVQEFMNDFNGDANAGDHYWPLTGTQVSDTDVGEHRKTTLRVRTAPTERADTITLYAKDVDSKAELFAIDEDGDEVQITSGGRSALGHTLTAKTGDYTVTAADCAGNTTLTNTGAVAVVTFGLPTGAVNYKVSYIVTDTDGIRIDPNASETFVDFTQSSSAGKYISSSTIGNSVTIAWNDGSTGRWQITDRIGTWAIED